MKLLRTAQNRIERFFSSATQNESVLRSSTRWASSITWGLIATTGLSISWLALAKTEEIVVTQGTLVPIGSVQDIQMPLGGVINEILVEDGEQVKENQILIKLDTEATSERQLSINKNLKLKQKQLELKKTELSQFIKLYNDKTETLNKRVDFEKKILERFKSLSDVGAVAELQYLSHENSLRELEVKLRESIIDVLRQEAILGQDIQMRTTQIANLLSERTDMEVTLRYQVLRSPVDGVVFDLQPKGRGYTGKQNETLLKIVPIDALEAKVEIPSSNIGFVRNGMDADLSIDSFPATDFGVLQGEISKISSDALPPEPAKQKPEYRYPATITLKNQSLNLKNGNTLPLQPGMSLTANIKLRKVTYLQLLLGSFKDKADSLRRIGD